MSQLTRREALAGLGATAAGGVLAQARGLPDGERHLQPFEVERIAFEGEPVSVVVLGAGNRGNTYAAYAERFPEQMRVVGVAEPIPSRQQAFAKRYAIPAGHVFETAADALSVPQFADAIVISTPDRVHHGPAMKGLELGYDVLLEKPISTSWQECVEIRDQNRKYRRIVAVCHVLRYAPYFMKLKEICASGRLGEIVNVEHAEPVGYWHQAHSFVRGNWRNVETSCPMILAKSCHDLDVLRWLVDRPCRHVASFGSLKHFMRENAPPGSTERCTDGCPVEPDCPYSALKLYMKMDNDAWPVSVVTEDFSEEGRLKALREGPYGRCVYRCDNDVVDHQVVAIEFEDEIVASFTMSAFGDGPRRTRVMGTMGEVIGEHPFLRVHDFRRGEKVTYDAREAESGSGHLDGDERLMATFLKAVRNQDPSLISTSLDVSVESHLMAFESERSRLERAVRKL